MYDGELKVVLEKAVDALPQAYKSVFMLREIEGLSTAETAECLEISEENVKTRLHRARTFLHASCIRSLERTATWLSNFLTNAATESSHEFLTESARKSKQDFEDEKSNPQSRPAFCDHDLSVNPYRMIGDS